MTLDAKLAAYVSSRYADFKNPSSSASRLPSLYSDLARHRNSDAASFKANVEWWRKILTDTLKHGLQADGRASTTVDHIVLHVNETMRERWTVDQVGRPLGLGTVVVREKRAAQCTSNHD